MVFEHVEKLKKEYTDKYVVVDASRPDLTRFEGITGTVKTVNMSGRALVQFDAYDNIGWYDIDVDYLKIIDQPLPKPEPTAKDASEKAQKTAAAKQPAKPAGAKMSVADMLAAARGEKPGAATAKPAAKPAAATKPPADKTPAEKPSVGKTGASMSVADVLAAARGKKSTDPAKSPKAAPPPITETATETPTDETSLDAETPDTSVTTEVPPAAAQGSARGATPRSELPQSVAEILAFCRKADSKA